MISGSDIHTQGFGHCGPRSVVMMMMMMIILLIIMLMMIMKMMIVILKLEDDGDSGFHNIRILLFQ